MFSTVVFERSTISHNPACRAFCSALRMPSSSVGRLRRYAPPSTRSWAKARKITGLLFCITAALSLKGCSQFSRPLRTLRFEFCAASNRSSSPPPNHPFQDITQPLRSLAPLAMFRVWNTFQAPLQWTLIERAGLEHWQKYVRLKMNICTVLNLPIKFHWLLHELIFIIQAKTQLK